MIEWLKTIGAFITSICTLIAGLITIEKVTKGAITRWLLQSVLDKLDNIEKRVDKLELNDLKQIIMNDNIPISERITAGERYIALGGNGDIKAHYKVLAERYNKKLENWR